MEPKLVRVCVRVPERYRRQLKIAAATQGEGLEEFCLRALNSQLEQPGSSAPGPLGELTAEEQRSLLRYLDLMRTNEGLAGIVRKRVDQSLAVAREQPAAVDYTDQSALVERVATEVIRKMREQMTEQLAHLEPLPGTGAAFTEALNRALGERNVDPTPKPQADSTEPDNLELLELLKRRAALIKERSDIDVDQAHQVLESLIRESKKRGDEESLPISVEGKST